MFYDIDFKASPDEIRLYLCKNDNDRTEIAELYEAKNRVLTMNYGGVGQLKFNIPYKVKKDMRYVPNPNFHNILGDYLVKYVKGNTIIYFKITNPENIVGDDGKEERTVLCHELHYEWKDKIVRLYSGTKKLYDPLGTAGVMNDTLQAKTEWVVDHVDTDILTKFRTFDESQVPLLEFVYSTSSKYGNVIPVVDTVSKKVSFYLDENIVYDEGLEITYGKYLKSLNQNENFDNVVTRLYVYGKDNISINSVNVTGTDYLESFDFYMHGFEQDGSGNVLSSSPYMSDDLCKAIISYNTLLDSKKTDFTNLLSQKSGYQTTLVTKQNEMSTLQTQMIQLVDTKNLYISTGQDLTSINSQIAAKQSEINSKQSEINTINSDISSVDSQITTLKSQVSIENNFTGSQIIERNKYVKESVWQDSNYTTAQDLYDEAISRLPKVNQPIVEYQVNAIDFVQALNTSGDWNKLKLGAVVTIRYPNYNISVKAKVISFDHDIDGKSINLTIANVKDIKSGILKIMNLLNRATNTSAYVDLNKFKINNGDNANTAVQQLLNESWDANKRAIESGSDLQTIVDRNGLTIKSSTDPNKYLRAINSVIAITADNGVSWKNALTSTGLVAERLYGQIIAGQDLTIQNSSGTFTVDASGATLTDMDLTLIRSDVKSRIKINPTDGITIAKNTGTTSVPVWTNQISLDTNGNALFGGTISIGSGNSIIKADSNTGFWLGNSAFASAKFRVNMNGDAYANSMTLANSTFSGGSFTGDITCTGTIKGGTIEGDMVRAVAVGNPNWRIELSQNGLRTYNPYGTLEGVAIDLSIWDDKGALRINYGGMLRSRFGVIDNQLRFDNRSDLYFGWTSGNTWSVYFDDRVVFRNNVTITSANFVATTTASVGSSGSAASLPSLPSGYISIEINGVTRRIPYYNS